jgi:hypothetical protein
MHQLGKGLSFICCDAHVYRATTLRMRRLQYSDAGMGRRSLHDDTSLVA